MKKSALFLMALASFNCLADAKPTVTMIRMNIPGIFNLNGPEKGKGSQDQLEERFMEKNKGKYEFKTVEATNPSRIVELLKNTTTNYCFSYSGHTYFPPDTLFSHPIGVLLNFGFIVRKKDLAKYPVTNNMVSLVDTLGKTKLRGVRTAMPPDMEELIKKSTPKGSEGVKILPDVSAQMQMLKADRADFGLNYYSVMATIPKEDMEQLAFLPISELESSRAVRVAFTCSPTPLQKQITNDINDFVAKDVITDKKWVDAFLKNPNPELEKFLHAEYDKLVAPIAHKK